MDKKGWREKIKKTCVDAGTYESYFLPVINTLADILEQRDAVYKQYVDEGSRPVREYTNKGGATNTTKNPLLVLWDELNKSALAYWRDLGLTPSSYKKMTGDSPQKKEVSTGLLKALGEIDIG